MAGKVEFDAAGLGESLDDTAAQPVVWLRRKLASQYYAYFFFLQHMAVCRSSQSKTKPSGECSSTGIASPAFNAVV